MSWTRVYRLTLRLLPNGLHLKHGAAMEALFAREIGRAYARGRLEGVVTGVAGVLDVVRRCIYERMRPSSATPGGLPMPTSRQLLSRLAISFSIALGILTPVLLAPFGLKQVPTLHARGAPFGTIVEVLVLAVPFIAALTIPMAVLVAVLYEFTRLGADGTLATASRERSGVQRLLMPVFGAAIGVAALSFVVTAEIVPRTNAHLSPLLAGHARPKSDRELTMGELRAAAREVKPIGEPELRRISAYEVEFQKKLALPASCLVMAAIGVALALRVPRGGTILVIGASIAVFGAYYMLFVTGESLADRLVVSPFVAMWGANAVFLLVALLAGLSWRAPRGRAAVAVHG